MNKKIVIYTCITGGYDTPIDNFKRKDGYDYVLISDVNIKTKCWKQLMPIFNDDENLTPAKKSRCVKTHPFFFFSNDYDISVYIDSNTAINQKLYDYIDKYKDNKITFKKHPYRDCIYDEIKECCLRGKETQPICENIYNRYVYEKYPIHNGLFENNIIISHHNDPTVRKIYEAWWDEIYNNSKRDQFSLNYILWKNKWTDYVSVASTNDFNPKKHKAFK